MADERIVKGGEECKLCLDVGIVVTGISGYLQAMAQLTVMV